jgi:hypothetical protein
MRIYRAIYLVLKWACIFISVGNHIGYASSFLIFFFFALSWAVRVLATAGDGPSLYALKTMVAHKLLRLIYTD